MRNSRLVQPVVLLLIILIYSCNQEENSRPVKPNILFILVDDLGWTDLGCYGSTLYETPAIDELARSGVLFTDAYAPASICSPSRAAIMTGKHPVRLNITDWIPGSDPSDRLLKGPRDLDSLPLGELTMAEILIDRGYTTFFSGKWHLGNEGNFPEDQGFQVNIGGHHRGSPPGGYFSPYRNPKLTDGPEGEYLTDRLTDETINFISNSSETPFFAFLSFYTVHTPIQANPDFLSYYEEKINKSPEDFTPELRHEKGGITVTNQYNPAFASMVMRIMPEQIPIDFQFPAFQNWSKICTINILKIIFSLIICISTIYSGKTEYRIKQIGSGNRSI